MLWEVPALFICDASNQSSRHSGTLAMLSSPIRPSRNLPHTFPGQPGVQQVSEAAHYYTPCSVYRDSAELCPTILQLNNTWVPPPPPPPPHSPPTRLACIPLCHRSTSLSTPGRYHTSHIFLFLLLLPQKI